MLFTEGEFICHQNDDEELHRTDGPALICPNGDREWYINGQLHREDGPAREYANGAKEWWVNGKRHREDGPAIEYRCGDKEWHYQGQEINCQSQEEFERVINLLAFE